MSHPAMNSVTTTSGTSGFIGAYPSTLSQAFYPQTEEVQHPVRAKTMFKVDTVENGYVLSIGHEGLYGKTYICPTPKDLADQIIASMVTQKMEK